MSLPEENDHPFPDSKTENAQAPACRAKTLARKLCAIKVGKGIIDTETMFAFRSYHKREGGKAIDLD